MTEYLPNKHESLASIPRTKKNKKIKLKRRKKASKLERMSKYQTMI